MKKIKFVFGVIGVLFIMFLLAFMSGYVAELIF